MACIDALVLDNNAITSIPNNMSTLTSLRILDLGHNRLPEIPESVCFLGRLEELNVSYNRLTAVPDELRRMSRLLRVSVRGNEISKLPDVFSSLNLVLLDVCNNPLQEVPLSLGSLVTSMQELFIDRNLHLADPPDVMICRGTKLLLSYLNRQYEALQSQVCVPDWLAVFQLACLRLAQVVTPAGPLLALPRRL
jgi:hypothetical protein